MADRLTQLQDCLDDLLTQMYAPSTTSTPAILTATFPINLHKHLKPIPAKSAASQTTGDGPAAGAQQGEGQNGSREPSTPSPETQNTFNAALRELAQDLILKSSRLNT
ncbi:unnamed protein product [Zymoseptoria tritici ST99CH_3D1]|nr:unnamed protein product [Zymoseptoria tritici ST99CH_3D1]